MNIKKQNSASIGLQIRKYREAGHISQEQLAHQAGLSTVTIGKIERGENNPKAETLIRIAKALEIPCQTLFEIHDGERSLFTPQIHRLVQYAKALNNEEVNALCVMAKTLIRIRSGRTKTYQKSFF